LLAVWASHVFIEILVWVARRLGTNEKMSVIEPIRGIESNCVDT
jgi:hypothetical protein